MVIAGPWSRLVVLATTMVDGDLEYLAIFLCQCLASEWHVARKNPNGVAFTLLYRHIQRNSVQSDQTRSDSTQHGQALIENR